MRVFLQGEGSRKRVLVSGPGDVAGRVGTLWVEGVPSDEACSKWALAFGLFAARGGAVRWL